ncbi:MAG: hypothetical protein J7M05_08290 [Anaerolineae bacterium]|nr:hypothetical protein [Anaerolineae bacterium]
MIHEHLFSALERALAGLVRHFVEMPDAFAHRADLLAAAQHLLMGTAELARPYTTRDGRRVSLVHCHWPSYLCAEPPAPSYDLAVLDPSFVRGRELAVVYNRAGQGGRLLRALPAEDRPWPLLAVLALRLVEELSPGVLDGLEETWQLLAQAEQEARRSYLLLFCRHWDLEAQILPARERLERWAASYPEIPFVVVQAFYDDIGRVSGGRYWNLWTHMAPLPPLDSLPPTVRRPGGHP